MSGVLLDLPLLPLRGDFSLGVGQIHELMIGRQQSVMAVRASLNRRKLIALGIQKDPKIVSIRDAAELKLEGAFGYIIGYRELGDGPIKAIVKVATIGKVTAIYPTGEYISADLEVGS